MKFSRIALLLIFSISALAASDSPDTREITDPKSVASTPAMGAIPIPVDDLFYTRSVGGGAWSPDGKQVVFSTNLTGRNNLWKVGAEGGWPIQLSQSDDRQSGATWSPDGKWIVFQSDKGGGEIYDLFAIPSDGGDVVNLTNTPETSETSAVWSRDGKTLAFDYKPKTASATDIAVMDWKTRAVRNLTQEKTANHLWSNAIWSPDGKYIYATRLNAGFSDSDVYRIEVATGVQENLSQHEGDDRTMASSISPDGATLLVASDRPGGYSNVAEIDVATKKLTWVTDLKWEANAGDFSPDGKQFTYVVNEDGRTDAYLADSATRHGAKINLPAGLNSYAGNPSPFAYTGARLLVSHQSSTQPGDLWVYDIAQKTPRQLTFSAIASLTAAKIPPSQLVHYKSFDGKIISAFVWVPFNLKHDGSNPAIVLPHGGPTGQTTDYFNRTVVALATRGYICIAPNVRGSTGYGKTFLKLDNGMNRDHTHKDIGSLLDWIKQNPELDAGKIMITGGSYGGYMTWAVAYEYNDKICCSLPIVGPSNLVTFLEHTEGYRRDLRRVEYGDERDPQMRVFLEAISPIAHVDHITKPMFIVAGRNDPRVPYMEGQQMTAAIRERGVPVWYLLAADEGHGFAKKGNRDYQFAATVMFIRKYLLE